MATGRETLRLTRTLRTDIGALADRAVRSLTTAWGKAWRRPARAVRRAVTDIVALATKLGRWPTPWEIARLATVSTALIRAETELLGLAQRTGAVAADAAANAITATVTAEPHILAAHLPRTERAAAAKTFDRVTDSAVEMMVRRTRDRIVARSWPLSDAAVLAMRRELVRGVATDSGPREAARRMVDAVGGAFNGGLARAVTIAQTEILDAHRAAARAVHMANGDVLVGWRWQSDLSARSCVACWSMHGRLFPVDAPGPEGHPGCRCVRAAVLRPWAELGIQLDEPADVFPDAEARFNSLTAADQLAVLGPARLDLYRSGRIVWADLATRRDSRDWRPSYIPTPLADLRRRAPAA